MPVFPKIPSPVKFLFFSLYFFPHISVDFVIWLQSKKKKRKKEERKFRSLPSTFSVYIVIIFFSPTFYFLNDLAILTVPLDSSFSFTVFIFLYFYTVHSVCSPYVIWENYMHFTHRFYWTYQEYLEKFYAVFLRLVSN